MSAKSPEFVHLMAYGNSDQVSFRHPQVRDAIDIMTVPGTIASYYDEATAAFVLSVQIRYLIDPRTPLFQNVLESPRASHFTLGEWHGATVSHHMREGLGDEDIEFPASFWTADVIDEMVHEVVQRQRAYAGKASSVTKKLDRYARLLAEAMQEHGVSMQEENPSGPSAVLAPYFAVTGQDDEWWPVMQQVWRSAEALDEPTEIRPVLCVGPRRHSTQPADGVDVLAELLPHLPDKLAPSCVFWITGFDERTADPNALLRLYRLVEANSANVNLVNLYGGFFSICLRYAGLRGFGNGLTYSESRAWPALTSTGAAPPRYYVPRLHRFMPQAAAADLVRLLPLFECPCDACGELRASGGSIAAMPYHALKRHFALARRWEIEMIDANEPNTVAGQLRQAWTDLQEGRELLPPGAAPDVSYLERWAAVLDDAASRL